MLYFRPTIERFLEAGGGSTPTERLQIEAHRWIRLNWIRVGLVAISWWGALSAVARHGWIRLGSPQLALPDGCVPFSAAAGEPRSLGTGRTRKENGPRNWARHWTGYARSGLWACNVHSRRVGQSGLERPAARGQSRRNRSGREVSGLPQQPEISSLLRGISAVGRKSP